ncbi:MAG: hypothetical protein AVDCRST_MAG09-791, partial [uncultured Sphingomonas sp.]
ARDPLHSDPRLGGTGRCLRGGGHRGVGAAPAARVRAPLVQARPGLAGAVRRAGHPSRRQAAGRQRGGAGRRPSLGSDFSRVLWRAQTGLDRASSSPGRL